MKRNKIRSVIGSGGLVLVAGASGWALTPGVAWTYKFRLSGRGEG